VNRRRDPEHRLPERRHTYKVESVTPSINAHTRLLAVLGHPVGHSLSPEMHNAALAVAGMDCVYVAFDVHPHRLAGALAGMAALGFVGANLTIPHKEAAVGMMADLSPEARALGAVNTVSFHDGLAIGHNTDVQGLLEPLLARGVMLQGLRAVVMGAGGAARGAVYGLMKSGAEVTIVNRTVGRAEALAEHMGRALGVTAVRAAAAGSREAKEALLGAGLLVNATSAGMAPDDNAMPDVPEAALRKGLTVFDLIYRPRETRLLRVARCAGCEVLNGVPMLVHQGAASFEAWFGVEPDVGAMERAVLAALTES